MAFAILKGLGAPAEVSSAVINAADSTVTSQSGCRITRVSHKQDTLRFVRLDEGMPLNLGFIGLLSYRFVPIPDELNRYMLTVSGLPGARYDVSAGGRRLGTYSREQLQAGVNLCSATTDPWTPGGPWDAKAEVLRQLTDSRTNLAMAQRSLGFHLSNWKDSGDYAAQSRAINERLEKIDT